MKFKKVLFILVFVLSMLIVKTVKAASPESFTLISNGHMNKNGEILRGYSSDLPSFFAYKYANVGGSNYIVLCTGYRRADATSGTTYRKNNSWSAPVRAGIAAIIINGIGDGAKISNYSNTSSDLYFTQIALWKYIQQEVGTDEDLDYTLGSCNSTQLAKVNNLYNLGESAKTKYNKIDKFSISTSSQKLSFTLNGNEYVSNSITVSGDELKSTSATVNKGTVVKNGNSYVVKVPKSELSSGKNTITLKIDAKSNSIPVANNYSNGKSSEQTLTITLFDYYSKTATKSISGDIIKTVSVKISKQDITNSKELPGATLVLTKPDGTTETWQSGTTPKEFADLPAGKYTLTETIAPDGYVRNTETITFNVKSDGTVDKNPVVMKNSPKDSVYISKVDATTGKELPGATLVLKDSKGNVVDSWTSESTPHKVKVKLNAGKYTLTETIAPNGYVKNTTSVTFTVEEDGTVSKPVIMENVPKGHVYISKQDATTSEELPGAKLILKDSEGKEVDSWTSGITPHKVQKILPAGKYTLTETIAPDGYVKSSETVTFTVKEDGTTDGVVVMKNEPKEVDDNPPTGTTLMFSLIIAFVSFAVSFYYYADYKVKGNM